MALTAQVSAIVTPANPNFSSCSLATLSNTLSRGEGVSEADGSGTRAETLWFSNGFRLSKAFSQAHSTPVTSGDIPSPGGDINR